ncbi:E3 ubiquitin-protein ligase TTC3 like protein [Argiope bruennichi]|uniref:RING-type E3 ubiquitin transferase n=1 Tax=Argiope bruennichi TaxID=94029 RepID=A0A8T0ELA7_ARGBR|nr:E3 ubiquitin-protein ligase TTC3 like protein [Argiope bruennichi]
MFRGSDTTELFENCLKEGFCDEHLKELQVQDESQRYELQRKTMLYIRLQILRPILFDKPFSTEKIRTLLEEAGYFNIGKNLVSHEEFIEQVLTLDSVVVFILIKLAQVCCAGALFRTSHRISTDNPLFKLLTQKTVEAKDVAFFGPVLYDNFRGYDEGLIKISYVAVLLYVRNVAMHMSLRHVLDQQDLALQNLSKEGGQWNDVGSDAFKRRSWEEAVDAFTKAIEFNPYCVSLLMSRAHSYMELNKFNDAALDCYMALMIKPTHYVAYCKWTTSLYILSQFSECVRIAEYGLKMCKETGDAVKYRTLEKIKIEASNALEKKKVVSKKEELNVPEKDLPELIEASDSEVECQDVPELMDPSNSDESDSESEWANSKGECQPSASSMDHLVNSEKNKVEGSASKTSRVRSSSVSDSYNEKMNPQINHEKNKSGHSASKASRVRNSSVSDACDQKDNSEERIKMLQMSLKDASNTLLDGCEIMAMRRFRNALDEIKAAPEIHKYEECDIICIKYAYAFACYQSGGYDDLQKAIIVFQEIIEEHKNVAFPAAYFTIGQTFLKLNRFKQALQYFKMLDDTLQKGVHSQVYVWPGVTATINETKLDYLRERLPALIKECENPPPPDAICRYEGCALQPSIYYTDPDFKGFFTINCSEQCNLQYHPHCWKNIKMAKNCTDKLFLEQRCFTPDCEGLIIKIQNISKEGDLAKEFVYDDGKKCMKQKKSKLEKKLEIKEEKRRKRKDSSSRTDSTSEVPEEIANGKFNEPETTSTNNEFEIHARTDTKDNNGSINGSNTSQLPVNAEPHIVLKKDKFIQETSNKIPTKVKDHKKVKNNTFSIDEFLQHTDAPLSSNDCQQRLNTLRQNNQSLTDGVWLKSSTNNAQQPVTSFTTDNTQHHSSPGHLSASLFERTKMQETGLDDFPDVDFPKPLINVSECLKKNIYSYFREILGKCGPLRVDDPALMKKIKSFPEEARIIADYGGIGKFLQQNVEFAFVKDTYICLVEQLPLAYRKINEAVPISDSDLKLSENYESFDSADKSCSEIFRFSGLNPDAREYKPGASEMGKLGRRQLLEKDLENTLKNDLNADIESSQQLNTEGEILSRKSSFSSTNSSCHHLIHADSHSGNKVTELVDTLKDLFKVYFSEGMNDYRPFIDLKLKPYAIKCVPKRHTRSIQTEETEKVSRGTMKTDDEIQELKDMTSQLIQDRKTFEQEYNAALEYAAKFQNESNLEIANLRKQLEDKLAALDDREKEFNNKEGKLEDEIKKLSEALKKVKVENVAQKKEMEKLAAAKDSLLLDRAHLEERVFSLQQEEQKLREDVNEDEKLKSSIKKLELEKTEAEKRAQSAELLLLQLKKSEFLKRIEIKKEEAAKKIKEVQDGIAVMSGSLNSLYIKSIDELLTQIRNYIALLEDIKTKFIVTIDEQINDVTNGIPISKLKPLEVQELPDIPIWNVQQMASMFTSQSMWGAPQKGNSAYNTGSFNPFSFASFNPLSLTSKVPGSQQTNQEPKQQIPLQNGPRSACNDSVSQPSIASVPPITKAPPGLQSTITSSFHAPATSMLNLNSSLKQSTVNEETKLKGASNSNVASAATSACSSDGKVQFAYAAAAPLPNAKMPSEKKISTSALELDYKVKNNRPAEYSPPLSVNIPPKTTSVEPKKGADKDAKKSFEKLLSKLQEKFPNYSHTELINCVKEFRTKRKSGLSGLSLDNIINSVSEIIEAKMKNAPSHLNAKMPDSVVKPKAVPNVVLVNKKLAAETKAKEPTPVRETSTAKKTAWGVSDSESSKQWTGSEIDEGCIICYEDMTHKTAYKVDCGHHFHFKCIKEWLNKKSDCPICRVHLLLPEDYPALS